MSRFMSYLNLLRRLNLSGWLMLAFKFVIMGESSNEVLIGWIDREIFCCYGGEYCLLLVCLSGETCIYYIL